MLNLQNLSKSRLRELVGSGALHPLALVCADLVAAEREHPLQQNESPPVMGKWPQHRYLYDMLANTCQREIWHVAHSQTHYFKLKDQIELAVFGELYKNTFWGKKEGHRE